MKDIDHDSSALRAEILAMLPKLAEHGKLTNRGTLVGKCMRELKGRASPAQVLKIVNEWKDSP